MSAGNGRQPQIAVFAPIPLLTITVEQRGENDDIHLHAGGQGFWLARMIAVLGAPVTLCGSFGGETGMVLRTLMERERVTVHGVTVQNGNPSYIHDRRDGERHLIAEMPSPPLSRHEVDELYALTLVDALDSDVCILGGPAYLDAVPPDTYRRLAADLRNAGKTVVADLSGEPLRAALRGGVSVLKASHEALVEDGWAAGEEPQQLVEAMAALRVSGADRVVVTRAELPALATGEDDVIEVVTPRLEATDHRGAGDAMTAGISVALSRGGDWESALRLGAAAGALNVTRRGLGTGSRAEIERFGRHVALHPVDGQQLTGTRTESPEGLAARVLPQ